MNFLTVSSSVRATNLGKFEGIIISFSKKVLTRCIHLWYFKCVQGVYTWYRNLTFIYYNKKERNYQMKVNARMKYLGADKGTSKDGKPYFYVGLLQGFDSERVYVNEEMYNATKGFNPFADVDCELNISIGQRTFVNLEKITLCK